MLSVIVIAKNEQSRIKTCLESVKWADEIIVADNGSDDKTLEIAKKYTDKIFVFEGEDFAKLRDLAFEKSRGDWVLYVDADERVLTSLRDEVLSIVNGNEKKGAYAISRRNIIFGSEETYGPFWPDWVIRLLRRDDFEGWIGKVHEYAKFRGELGYTKNSFLHLTHRNLDQIVLKSLEWSRIDAKLRLDANHPKMSGWRFLRIFVSETFNQGVIRRGFFSGSIGVMDSILQAFSLYMTYVRLWEIQQKKSLNEIYDDVDKKLETEGFNYT